MENLFESLHDAVLFVEEDRIFTCNSKALDMWGCATKEELLGNSLSQLSPTLQPDGQNSKVKILKKSDSLTIGQTIKFEWQFLRRDCSRWDAEVHLRAFQFDDRCLTQAVVHDLTDQRALAWERREGRQRLYGIIQSLPTPAFVIDKDHITVFWNKALEQLSGIRAFDVLGTSNHWRAFHDIEGPCLADMLVDEAYDRISERYGGKCTPSEYIKGAYEVTDLSPQINGKSRWLHHTCSILRDTEGRTIGAIEVLEDRTEWRKTEASLQKTEERYRDLFNNVRDGIYRITPDGHDAEANDAFARMLGLESLEEAKEALTNIIPKDCYDPEYRWDVYGMHDEPGTEDFEVEIRRKDGGLSSILNRIRIIRDEKGRFIRCEGVARDVTEQRSLEKALGKAEREKATLVDALSELVVLLDKNMRIVWSNRALFRHFRLKPGEVRGTRCYESIHQLKRPCKICPAVKAMESGRPQIVENVNAGGKRWILKAYPLRDERGNLDGVIEIATDITQQKQTREELTHTTELLRHTLEGTIQAMSVAVETRDPYTAGHQKRVADLAYAIALEMGLSHKQINGIRMAAAIHDIGKICVPAEILTRPTSLSAIEFDLVKVHSRAGYEILKDIEFPWPIARMILEHHEKIDGSGYPNGLSGDNILIESRVLAVADVVEAINSHRPYRPALGVESALAEIHQNMGTYYDPDVVKACLKLFREKSYILKTF